MGATVYDFRAKTLKGEEIALSEFDGKVLLIVNTASKCGFTPQYEGLETLHKKFKEKGLEVLGFPCNQFGKQEPGDSSDIHEFCQLNYGVSFRMFEKVDVNGRDAHPLFQYLTSEAAGILGTKRIKWNFTKFLVGKDGRVVERFAPSVKPEELEGKVAALL